MPRLSPRVVPGSVVSPVDDEYARRIPGDLARQLGLPPGLAHVLVAYWRRLAPGAWRWRASSALLVWLSHIFWLCGLPIIARITRRCAPAGASALPLADIAARARYMPRHWRVGHRSAGVCPVIVVAPAAKRRSMIVKILLTHQRNDANDRSERRRR